MRRFNQQSVTWIELPAVAGDGLVPSALRYDPFPIQPMGRILPLLLGCGVKCLTPGVCWCCQWWQGRGGRSERRRAGLRQSTAPSRSPIPQPHPAATSCSWCQSPGCSINTHERSDVTDG